MDAAQQAAAAATAGGATEAALWITGAMVLGLLVLSAFFSGSETALTAASRARLQRLADEGSKGARTALRLTEDNERLIGSVLLGNNLVNILATSLATSVLLAVAGESGVALATVAMTLLVLIFAEVLPKTYAITRPEAASTAVAPLIGLIVRLFAPVVSLVRWIVRGALALFGVETDPQAHIMAHEEIRGAIDLGHSEGVVERDARNRLLGALELDDRDVSQVMIHRKSILMINCQDTPEAILDAALRSPYTRIPLFRGDQENIVGVIHAKDLLRAVDPLIRGPGGSPERLAELDVLAVAMDPWFVPETTSLSEQLQEFLNRRQHFALVVDEYGSLQGLVTLEDILEEIVGEISDEFDDEVEGVSRESEHVYVVDGATAIRDLNRKYDWKLPEDEATTIAGLVIHGAQAIPSRGQTFEFHGFKFEVLERDRHVITRLRLSKLTAGDHQAG
ncbi:MAG: HlyC/CorC family transporter [Pseudomonadota bacterium]